MLSGPLLVNVSVLLLSLASPDESSLVKHSTLIRLHAAVHVSSFVFFPPRIEVRGGVFTATTMVRPSAAVLEPEQVRLSERHSPPRRHLGAGHVFHHARRLQSFANTGALFPADLPKRQRTLFDEVVIIVVITFCGLCRV